MTRLSQVFQNRSRELLMTFTVAGDPDYETSLGVIKAMEEGGADIIELGLPFSDPVADGPVIQKADQRALNAGMNTDRFFALVHEFRQGSDIPLVVLTYTNLVLQRNIEKFYQDAADAGIDAVVIADLPFEEAGPYIAAAEKNGISPVMMVSTTTSEERLTRILQVNSGFIYLVAALGVTGVRKATDQNAKNLLIKIKSMTDIPVAPGFGISDNNQIREWGNSGADAVIVGSALVKIIDGYYTNHEELIPKIISFVKNLKE